MELDSCRGYRFGFFRLHYKWLELRTGNIRTQEVVFDRFAAQFGNNIMQTMGYDAENDKLIPYSRFLPEFQIIILQSDWAVMTSKLTDDTSPDGTNFLNPVPLLPLTASIMDTTRRMRMNCGKCITCRTTPLWMIHFLRYRLFTTIRTTRMNIIFSITYNRMITIQM